MPSVDASVFNKNQLQNDCRNMLLKTGALKICNTEITQKVHAENRLKMSLVINTQLS